jgi:hypothetical protein
MYATNYHQVSPLFARYVPIFRWGTDCSGARLRTDLIAGATVRVVMMPVEM